MADLIGAAFAEYRGRIEPESAALRETAASIAERFADHRIVVAVSGGALVGCVIAKRQGEDVYLGRLSVLPAWRRDGIAGRLLADIEDYARAAGARAVTLGVRIALPGNRRFFEARGYREVGRDTHEGFDRPTSLRLAKPTAA